jgi:cytochrome b561
VHRAIVFRLQMYQRIMPSNTTASWGRVSRYLHWSMAVLLTGQVLLGRYSEALERSPEKLSLMMWHKSIGISLLLLVLVRFLWARMNPVPDSAPGTARWVRYASGLSHRALYVLMVTIPLTGWLMNSAKNIPFRLFRVVPWPSLLKPDAGLGRIFESWHSQLVTALLVLVCIHVAAALWHHFCRRDATLKRMLGWHEYP